MITFEILILPLSKLNLFTSSRELAVFGSGRVLLYHIIEAFSRSWQMRWSNIITIFTCFILTKVLASLYCREIRKELSLKSSTALEAMDKHSGDRVMSAVRSRLSAAFKINPSNLFIRKEHAKLLWSNLKQAVGALYHIVILDPLRSLQNLHGSLKSARAERSNLKAKTLPEKIKGNRGGKSKNSSTIYIQPPNYLSMPDPSTLKTTAKIRGPDVNDQISIFVPSIAASQAAVKSSTSLPIFKQTVENNFAKFKKLYSSELNNLYLLSILLVVLGCGIYYYYLDYGQSQIKFLAHHERLSFDIPRNIEEESDDSDADIFSKDRKVSSLVEESLMEDSIFMNYHDRTEAKESFDECECSSSPKNHGRSTTTECSDLEAADLDYPYAERRQNAREIKYASEAMLTTSAKESETANLVECESFEVMTVFDSLSDSVSTATSTNVSPSYTTERHVNVKTFTCSYPFDQNGIISYLTSVPGVHKGKSAVRAKMSSIFLGSEMTILTQSLDHSGLHSYPNYTQNEANSWCAIDIGSGRRLIPTQYCIRHGASSTGNALRSWELRGRERENEEWDVIKAHLNDETLSSTPMSVALWDIEQKNFKKGVNELETDIKAVGDAATNGLKAYRYFLLLQTAINSSGNHCLFVGGMELYGVLTEK